MKILIISLFLCLLTVTAFTQSNLTGTWNTGNQNTLVKIYKQNEYYIGEIILTENENVKPGTLIMKDVTFNKGKWTGKMYAPQQKEWYNAELIPVNNKLTITVTVGFFSKTIEWTKTKNN